MDDWDQMKPGAVTWLSSRHLPPPLLLLLLLLLHSSSSSDLDSSGVQTESVTRGIEDGKLRSRREKTEVESKHEVSGRGEDEESECETLRHLNSSSSSSSAKSRTVYLLIIEKHQQAASSAFLSSPSPHRSLLWGRRCLEAWPPGEPSSSSSSSSSSSLVVGGLCSVTRTGRNFPQRYSARQNRREVIDLL